MSAPLPDLPPDDERSGWVQDHGVKHLLRTAGEFSVTLPGGPQKLGFFFFVGASMSRGEPQQKRYLEVARHAKDAELQLI